MAEGIALAVSILSLIERTVTVGQKLLSYYNQLTQAPELSLSLRKEFSLILKFLQNLKVTNASSDLEEYMTSLFLAMEDLWRDLEPRISEEKTRTWMGRVVWVFTVEETNELIKRVERLKTTYALVLAAVNYGVSQRIHENTEQLRLWTETAGHRYSEYLVTQEYYEPGSCRSCTGSMLFREELDEETYLAIPASPAQINCQHDPRPQSFPPIRRPALGRTDTNLSGTTIISQANQGSLSDTASLKSFSSNYTATSAFPIIASPPRPPIPVLEYRPHLYASIRLLITVKPNKKKSQAVIQTPVPGVKKTSISPSAKFAALFTDTIIYVFETSTGSLLWHGELDRGNYKYTIASSLEEREVKFQTSSAGGLSKFRDTPKFTAVGMSDEFIVVSAQGKTLFFATSGMRRGELVMYDLHEGTVDKFVFSTSNPNDNGGTSEMLLGLTRKASKAQARIYNTALLPRVNSEKRVQEPVTISTRLLTDVPLQYENFPKGAVFSSSGTLLAIYSNANAKGTATLWILAQSQQNWKLAAKREIQVLSSDSKARCTGTHIGITGLAFFGWDEFLQLSLQSDLGEKAVDCYRIIVSNKGTNNCSEVQIEPCKSTRFPVVNKLLSSQIAMSSTYNAAVFLEMGGDLHYQQNRQRRTFREGKVVLRGRVQKAGNTTSLVFAGERVYCLDTEGELHVHSFQKEMDLALPAIQCANGDINLSML